MQRVAMTLCLGKPADVYLIDEPSAYLDSEQRLVAAKVRFYDQRKQPNVRLGLAQLKAIRYNSAILEDALTAIACFHTPDIETRDYIGHQLMYNFRCPVT